MIAGPRINPAYVPESKLCKGLGKPCCIGKGTNSDIVLNSPRAPDQDDLLAPTRLDDMRRLHSFLRLRPVPFCCGKRPVPNSLHFSVGFAYTSCSSFAR